MFYIESNSQRIKQQRTFKTVWIYFQRKDLSLNYFITSIKSQNLRKLEIFYKHTYLDNFTNMLQHPACKEDLVYLN